ncbi:MAG: hypothetical protein AAF292_09935 [Pseudomonadota bacterium]
MFGNLLRLIAVAGSITLVQPWHSAYAHTPHDDVFSVAVSPDYATDGTVYTLTRSSVLKSTDTGNSWTRMMRGLDNTQMLVDLVLGSDGNTLYAASRGEGVFRSLDAGETWTNASTGLADLHIHALTVSEYDASTVIAVSAEGRAFISRNSGETWTALSGPFDAVTAAAFGTSFGGEPNIHIGDFNGNVFASSDGLSWTQLHDSTIGSPVFVIYASRDVLAFSDNAGNLFTQTDGDDAQQHTLSDASTPITSIAAYSDAEAGSSLFATQWRDGLYCSPVPEIEWSLCDDGLTVDQQAASLGRPNFSEVALSPTFSADGTLFVAAYDGLFKSTNGAVSHSELETFPINYIVSAEFSPTFAEDQQMLMTTMLWGLFESRDAGSNWQDINSGELVDYPRHNGLTRLFKPVYSPAFDADRTIFLSTWYAPLKSTDGGKSWQRLDAPQTESFKENRHQALVLATSPDFATDKTIYASTNWGEIIRSTDGGQSFDTVTKVENNSGSIAISPSYTTDGLVFAGDIRGIWRSGDRGSTWTQTQLVTDDKLAPHVVPIGYPAEEVPGFIEFLDVERGKSQTQRIILLPDFATSGAMLVAGSEGLFRSSDRGQSWTPVTNEFLSERNYIETVALSPDYEKDSTIIISVRGKGLLKSVDGSITFAPFATDLIDAQIQFSQFDGVAPKYPALLFSPNYANDRTLFGYEGDRFYRSIDAGESWAELGTPVPSAATKRLKYYIRNIYPHRFLIAGLVALGGLIVGLGLLYLFRRQLLSLWNGNRSGHTRA